MERGKERARAVLNMKNLMYVSSASLVAIMPQALCQYQIARGFRSYDHMISKLFGCFNLLDVTNLYATVTVAFSYYERR
jgi:hypothetical protein